MTHKEVIAALRSTPSRSKRELFDTAADMIERLTDKPVVTNADRIRAMSDEELIKLFDLEMQTCPPDAEEDRWCDMDDDCKRCWLEWLCKPVKEDA